MAQWAEDIAVLIRSLSHRGEPPLHSWSQRHVFNEEDVHCDRGVLTWYSLRLWDCAPSCCSVCTHTSYTLTPQEQIHWNINDSLDSLSVTIWSVCCSLQMPEKIRHFCSCWVSPGCCRCGDATILKLRTLFSKPSHLRWDSTTKCVTTTKKPVKLGALVKVMTFTETKSAVAVATHTHTMLQMQEWWDSAGICLWTEYHSLNIS